MPEDRILTDSAVAMSPSLCQPKPFISNVMKLTISSLQIGQDNLDEAAGNAATFSSFCPNETLELRSGASTDNWDVEADESTEIELADGDNKLVFLGATGLSVGNKDLPLPRILPPPRLLFDIVWIAQGYTTTGGVFHVQDHSTRDRTARLEIWLKSGRKLPPGNRPAAG